MAFGPLQRLKSTRQLWQRPASHAATLGRGAASLVLGADAEDDTATMQTGDKISVTTTGTINDTKVVEVRGAWRINALPPVGYAWKLTLSADGYAEELTLSETMLDALAGFPVTYDLDDFIANVAGAAGTVTLGFELEFVVDPDNAGTAGVDVDVTLPSVFIEQLLVPETVATDLIVGNRWPPPAETRIPNDLAEYTFLLVDVDGAGVDLTNTTITVDGVTVYTTGAFVLPWSGTTTTGLGPTAQDVGVVLNVPAALLPRDSEQPITIRVQSQLNGPASVIDTTWSFVSADTLPLAVQTATMIAKDTLRVTFTDSLRMDDSAFGALNPANWSTVRVSAPAVTLDVIAVEQVRDHPDTVDVRFNWEASMGALYSIVVESIEDDQGNSVTTTGQLLRFTGYVPPRPLGRRFELLDFVPRFNMQEDRTAAQGGDPLNPGTGELRKFLLVLQDVVDVLLCQIDRWTDIIDIDLASEQFLDAILQDLGNPFADCIADLDEDGKRRLTRVLISIYKQKGTEAGIINAVRFFLGLEITLGVVNERDYWQLGVSLLGVGTTLAPPVGSALWYSFTIDAEVVLTAEQRDRVLCIAEYMKGAHEHIIGITEPGDVLTPSDYWILNQSILGADPAVLPSTILA
jgi:phage tail-like protein